MIENIYIKIYNICTESSALAKAIRLIEGIKMQQSEKTNMDIHSQTTVNIQEKSGA